MSSVDRLAVRVFAEYARNSGNDPDEHFDRNAAEQWMAQALTECGVADLMAKAARWDDLVFAREKTEQDEDGSEWKQLARQGQLIPAIKSCRAMHGFGLKDAKDCVETYMGRARTRRLA